jgi:hypothetical protein
MGNGEVRRLKAGWRPRDARPPARARQEESDSNGTSDGAKSLLNFESVIAGSGEVRREGTTGHVN